MENIDNRNLSKSELDIVITTDYSPHFNSLKNLSKTISSLDFIHDLESNKLRYRIIIAVDALNPNYGIRQNAKRYTKYVRSLSIYNNSYTYISTPPSWGHLSGNLCHAFDYFVTANYVLVIQDDLPFVRNVPLIKIITHMKQNSDLKHIRFNRRPNMIWGSDSELSPYQFKDLHYLKTNNWSDNNHLAPSSYYRNAVLPKIRSQFTFPENIMGELNKINPKLYGTFIYGNFNEPIVIKHLGDVKRRVRMKMVKLGTPSIAVRYFITSLIYFYDLLKSLLRIFQNKFN